MLLPLVLAAALADEPTRTLTVEGALAPERLSPPSWRGAEGKAAWSVDLVRIPGGTFTFGPLPGEGDPTQPPGREVTVASLWIADVETPWGLFQQFCQASEQAAWPSPGWTCPTVSDLRADQPAVNVTWWDAVAFCNWLTLRELGVEAQVYEVIGAGDARTVVIHADREGYRLPTAEEWEWAARAGDPKARYAGYDNASWGCDYANTPYDACVRGTADVYDTVSPARPPTSGKGVFKPNAWGLFQMSGNVQEWTSTAVTDAKGSDRLRVLKGGSWELGRVVVHPTDDAKRATIDAGWVIYQLADLPSRARRDGGFRIARSL